jgi:hypothetical protein
MQNFVKPLDFGKEMGQSIGHFKILDVQPHMLPNFKLHMPSCFIELVPRTS